MSDRNSKLITFVVALAVLSFPARALATETNGDLPNFHQISATFYRGAQPSQNGIQLLAKIGVKTILNLRAADDKSTAEEEWAKEAGLRYFNLPMKGSGQPADTQVQAALSIINARENQPVFLHCKRGKDRTGTIVACYRIAHDHWTSEDAIKEARVWGMRWSEFGMKRYVRHFDVRQLQSRGNDSNAVPSKPQVKPDSTEGR